MYKQVQYLLSIPKIIQKSPEWYLARHNLITASDFAQALGHGKFGTQKQLIEKKVDVNTESKFTSNPFFEWGNLFEPVAGLIYSHLNNNIIIHEFGLIKHPTRDYFGASPDGITDDGIMLEIKCPFKRKINGEIPDQYYYQIQGQLDVCGLEECDYLECEFAKFTDYTAYKSSYNEEEPKHTKLTGTIGKNKDTGEYVYNRVYETLCDEINNNNNTTIYWYLIKYNIIRVKRDHQFVQEKLDELEKIWNKIVFYRSNPKQYEIEVKKIIDIPTEIYKFNKCMIKDLE